MITRIQSFAKKTGQLIPETNGEIIRCVYESLAMKYSHTVKEIMDTIGSNLESVHMVGGGIQSQMLCEMVANASGLTVFAGPVEATAIGNITVQLMSQGVINSLAKGRQWIKENFEIKTYYPEDTKSWQQEFTRYQQLLNKEVEDDAKKNS